MRMPVCVNLTLMLTGLAYNKEDLLELEPDPLRMNSFIAFFFSGYDYFVRLFCTTETARFFPKQVYLWGSILEKKRLDMLVGALCCIGRGFGCAGRAGPGWARAGPGWARIWLSVYGLRCACLLHVFVMSLCLSSCVSQMSIMGLEQNKA